MRAKVYSFILAILTLLLVACNGANVGGSGADPTSVTNDNSQVFSNSACLTATFEVSGTVKISNVCSSQVSLAGVNLFFKAQDKGFNLVNFKEEVVSTDKQFQLHIESIAGTQLSASIVAIGKTPSQDGLYTGWILQPNTSINFNSILVDSVAPFDNKYATSTSTITTLNQGVEALNQPGGAESNVVNSYNKEAQVSAKYGAKVGALQIGIDTRYASCGVWAKCEGLTVNISNESRVVVASVVVPSSKIGTVYSATVSNLPVGRYYIYGQELANTTLSIDNNLYNPEVLVGQSKLVDLRYRTSIGSLTVTVYTNYAYCDSITNCKGIGVNVVNGVGKIIRTFYVPESSFGKPFEQKIDGLPQGVYNFVGIPVTGLEGLATPSNGLVTVTAQRNSSVALAFFPNNLTNRVDVRVPIPNTWNPSWDVPLNFQIYNKFNNTLVMTVPIYPTGNYVTTPPLPVSNSTHKYEVFLTQGFANPQKNMYYRQVAPIPFDVYPDKINKISLGPVENINMVGKVEKIKVNVSGMDTSDFVNFYPFDSMRRFAYALPLKYDKNGTTELYVEKNALIGLFATASGANRDKGRYKINPIYSYFEATPGTVVNIAFDTLDIAATFSLPGTFSYAYDSLTYIPYGYFGLKTYVLTNVYGSRISNPSYYNSPLPANVTIDNNRTTCKPSTVLDDGQSCMIVFKYQPGSTTKDFWSSFPFQVKFKNMSGNDVYSSRMVIPYSSRNL